MSTSRNTIDLLPESIRLRCQQGRRTGRYIAAIVLAGLLIVTTATHSRVELERARDRYLKARETADMVLQTEARAVQITRALQRHEHQTELHDALAWPIRVTSLLSTIINRLPESVSLDRLEFTTSGFRAVSTAPRAAAQTNTRARAIRGELTGFAATDADISTLIDALEQTPPLQGISLDFSRTRVVRGQSAREFRMSFRIDLEHIYESPTPGDHTPQEPPHTAVTGVTHAR